ncbi:GtrA family protein [Corynebacterium uterequi]|uniref:Putative membrane protein n=1 Tax=Corynebacterium uterequi TaxID=1072256 RepID=A0A0G3HBR9_9CORY|nr:GtrA family protein [Corynebacterium uterequi]AKK10120.1 putative membrane protein [Corynebacterium uterequi]
MVDSRRTSSLRVQAARFTIAGVGSAFVDGLVTWLLQVGFAVVDGVAARTVGWLAGTLMAYVINRRWTFGADSSKRRFSATMVVYALTYVVNISLYRWLFPTFNHDLEWAQTPALLAAFAISQAVATVINFVVQRRVIFRATRRRRRG